MEPFLATADSHWGFQRVRGVLEPIHDVASHDLVLQVIREFGFKHYFNLGDGLDCGGVAHWNKAKKKSLEGLDLKADADGFRRHVLEPIRAEVEHCVYCGGNHDGVWLEDVGEEMPALASLVDLDHMLQLTANGWEYHPQGSVVNLGHLYFMHGDTIKGGGQYPANKALQLYKRNVRFGHFHTHQEMTDSNPLDVRDVHDAKALGCLCTRAPNFLKGSPNRWCQGFLVGHTEPSTGQFWDSHISILPYGDTGQHRRCVVWGREFRTSSARSRRAA